MGFTDKLRSALGNAGKFIESKMQGSSSNAASVPTVDQLLADETVKKIFSVHL